MEQTRQKYDAVIKDCKSIFMSKFDEYGPSWILFRFPSVIDQIFIKVKRIRRLEELGGKGKVPEGIDVEYKGIINYCVIALMKLWNPNDLPSSNDFLRTGDINDIKVDRVVIEELYDRTVNRVRETMLIKNHDYGEAWKDISLQSINDLILVKVYRIFNILESSLEKDGLKKKELNQIKGLEKLGREMDIDIDTHLEDILNYCAFALMKMD